MSENIYIGGQEVVGAYLGGYNLGDLVGVDLSKFSVSSIGSNCVIDGMKALANVYLVRNSYHFKTNEIDLIGKTDIEVNIKFNLSSSEATKDGFGLFCLEQNNSSPAMQYQKPNKRFFVGLPNSIGNAWQSFQDTYWVDYDLSLDEYHEVNYHYAEGKVKISVDGNLIAQKNINEIPLFRKGKMNLLSNFDGGISFKGECDLTRTYIKANGNLVWGIDKK